MRQEFTRWVGILLGMALAVPGVVNTRASGDEPRLADYFGFLPLEIYKLDTRLNNLQLGDIDGDKINDILVVNNGRSRIDLLLSGKKPGGDDAGAGRTKAEPNEIASDRRMRLVSVPVNKEVV